MTRAENGKRHVLLVRFGSMGDIIHSLPVAAALKNTYPEWKVDWLVEDRWRALVQDSPCVDRVLAADTFAWRRCWNDYGTWAAIGRLQQEMVSRRFDVAIDLQGAVKSALACRLSGAREIMGHEGPWIREIAAGVLYTRRVRSRATHIVQAHLELARAMGADISLNMTASMTGGTNAPRFPVPAGDPSQINASLAESLRGDHYSVINPSAGWQSKGWPAEFCAAVTDALWEKYGFQIVLNKGPGEDQLTERVQEICRKTRPIIFSGNVAGLIALLRGATLMVAPDTGPLHLAAALGVPTVGLFGPTDPARNGPVGPRVRTLRDPEAATSYDHSAAPDGSMSRIGPGRILEAIDDLLGG
jgi:heptosyltransferase-1